MRIHRPIPLICTATRILSVTLFIIIVTAWVMSLSQRMFCRRYQLTHPPDTAIAGSAQVTCEREIVFSSGRGVARLSGQHKLGITSMAHGEGSSRCTYSVWCSDLGSARANAIELIRWNKWHVMGFSFSASRLDQVRYVLTTWTISCPYWFLLLFSSVPWWFWLLRTIRVGHRRRHKKCLKCGYVYLGLPASNACPECGRHRSPDDDA